MCATNLPPGSSKHVKIGNIISLMASSQNYFRFHLFVYHNMFVRKKIEKSLNSEKFT